MKFSEIPGHESAKKRIIEMVDSNRIPHALLLEGTPGIGKFMLARAMAQYIHCENRSDGDSCGKWPACLQHQTFNHIDTHFVFPIIKGKLSAPVSDDYISEWRHFLSEQPFMDFQEWLKELDSMNAQPSIYVSESDSLSHKLNFTSHRARYKIVLLWLPERMQEAASNKLLKLIEEPHDDTLFIMVSNNSKEILPTIYSRTQRIEIKRLSDAEVASYLVNRYALDKTDAMAVSHLAEGSVVRAVNAISVTKEHHRFLELFISLMRLAYQRRVKELKDWGADVASLGREQELRFLDYCNRLIRENFIYNLNVPELNYMNREESEFSKKFARFINERNVQQIVSELDSAATDIAGNGNAKIVLFDFAVRVILLLKS